MRTTISPDEQPAKQVRHEPSEPPPFRLVTSRRVRPRPGVDLDRPRALEAADDEARFELRQR